MHRCDVGQAQFGDDFVQEVDAFAQCVEQHKLGFRAQNRQRHARKTGSRAHIEHAAILRHVRHECRTIEEMPGHDLVRVGDGGQVHDLVFLAQDFRVTQ